MTQGSPEASTHDLSPGLHRTPAPLLLVRETNPNRDNTRLHERGTMSERTALIGCFLLAAAIACFYAFILAWAGTP